ncbi:glutathione-disulfide reductase [Marinomonas mediterranea]|jgi:NADPH-glutathione reductase (EC 1.8.1.7)|uniref:Glutathione-disulfide reductase n=1 Tax=Marinomonas mediterranea (strain ATCC 700492 / JCM 21426 / NBRC 103028 / MMB-1) TaxID=717774 RepID=F2K2Q0_MARM1|nr:glutathione-disulfide reductase [Marinomonas mediterranea]ADZ91183.1 Glutathione-disulfide reductase [Marinomonas mediterranea MMB-1]WCN09158.1 glutathione-disulfide reductase [Marinomonas mediterranea]WCN13234.1 glutathione-disulfide reductase [Marinomonas mediterranea]WCN17310.1 glutathione-disulfide reductase [Marinomonas mediterranea MMB-1]
MSYQYDLFVIGAGSGGVRASRVAASKGYKVAVAESSALGGTCVNIGCVPKKLFVYGAEFSHIAKDAKGYGWSFSQPSFDWKTLRDNKTKEIERLNGIYGNLLRSPGVEIIEGHGKLIDAHTVEVAGNTYTAERILIAVGATPFVPNFPGNEHVVVSDNMFYLDELPSKALVVGGGYIAVEFAGILKGLGVDVSLAYRGDQLLRGFDSDVRAFASQEYVKSGVDVRLNTDVASIADQDGSKLVTFKDGKTENFGLVLYATGRVPNTANLGLAEIGVKMSGKGAIEINNNYQSNVESVYAIGDVTDNIQLTPVAIKEAMALLDYWFEGKDVQFDYDNIPTAVFSQPQIGTVGLSEDEADSKGLDIRVYQTDFKAMKNTLSGSESRSFMKLIVNNENDEVIGAHMVGDYAGEIIQGLGIAIKAGATKEHFDSTIGVHPTSAEEFVTFSANALKKR